MSQVVGLRRQVFSKHLPLSASRRILQGFRTGYRKRMRPRSYVFKLSALLLATVHVTGAELAGLSHGACAYHGDRAEHHAATAEPIGHSAPTNHNGTSGHEDASGTDEFHCTAACCCSIVAAPPALGSFGLLESFDEGPSRGSHVVAGRQALPRQPHVLPFANAPPVGC
jgi:hypothetical protein